MRSQTSIARASGRVTSATSIRRSRCSAFWAVCFWMTKWYQPKGRLSADLISDQLNTMLCEGYSASRSKISPSNIVCPRAQISHSLGLELRSRQSSERG
jgi:hypothetical protein